MRVIAPTLLALILLGNVACSGRSQHNSANGGSPQTDSAQWQASTTLPGAFRRDLVGNPRQTGPYKYHLKLPAGARPPVHKHASDVHIKVLSGSMFIILGEPLDPSRVQRLTVGSVFVFPAHTWHDEWWDEETVLEVEGVGPLETTYKNLLSQQRTGGFCKSPAAGTGRFTFCPKPCRLIPAIYATFVVIRG